MAKNSSWLMLSTVYQVGIVFLKSVVIARSLGLNEYGVYATIMAFVATVQELFNLNFGPALIKFSADAEANGRTDKSFALIKLGYIVAIATAALSVLGVAFVLQLFYYTFFETEGVMMTIVLFSFSTSLSFINTIPQVVLRIYNRFKRNSIMNMVAYTLEFASVVTVLILLDGSLTDLISALALISLVNMVLVNVAAFLEIKHQIWGFWNQPIACLAEDRRLLVSFVVNNSLSKTLQKLLKKGDVLLLAAFTGPLEVGLYDVARKLSFSLLVVKDPLIVAVYPQIAKLVSNNQRPVLKTFLRNIALVAILPFVLGSLILSFFGDEIIFVTFGSEFVGQNWCY